MWAFQEQVKEAGVRGAVELQVDCLSLTNRYAALDGMTEQEMCEMEDRPVWMAIKEGKEALGRQGANLHLTHVHSHRGNKMEDLVDRHAKVGARDSGAMRTDGDRAQWADLPWTLETEDGVARGGVKREARKDDQHRQQQVLEGQKGAGRRLVRLRDARGGGRRREGVGAV